MFKIKKPDIVLLDINLGGEKDGIDIAAEINKHYHVPFIFLTANSDGTTIERAKEVKPFAYLVKPFTKDELFASIEIAFNNYISFKISVKQNSDALKQHNYIFIRDSHRFIKLLFENIIFLESRDNYIEINTTDKKKIITRHTLSDFLSELPAGKFYRTHRSFAINTDMIDNIENNDVFVGGIKVPLSSTYRDGLFQMMGIR
jgi:DNA-binding LytR/AlgR family response regulator